MKKRYVVLFVVLILTALSLAFYLLEDSEGCKISADCNFNTDGNCANVPYNPDIMVSDHPGCACENGECVDAPCEEPCMLG